MKPIIKFLFIFASLLILIPGYTYSQDTLTFENVDTRTYELYNNKNWVELIRLGKKALEERIDSYTLRIRLGTAYYQLKNYSESITHFEKAMDLGYADDLIYEYLYNSFMYTGRIEEKNFTFTKLSEYNKKRLRPLNNPFIDNIYIHSGMGISNDDSHPAGITADFPGNAFSEQVTFGDFFYFNAGIRQLPFDRLILNYDYSYLKFDKMQEIYIKSSSGLPVITSEYQQIQNRFYNSIDVLAMNGLVVSPAAHYINSKENRNTLDSITDLIDSSRVFNFSNKEFIRESFILSLTVSKYVSVFKFGLSGSFSYLNEHHQSQYGLSFSGYPFGNVFLKTNTEAVFHIQNKLTDFILTQALGIKVTKNLDFTAYASFGKIQNFNEQNGRTVFNDEAVTKFGFGADIIYNITNNLAASFSFSHQKRERDLTTYSEFENSSNIPLHKEIKKLNYDLHFLLAGIKFYF